MAERDVLRRVLIDTYFPSVLPAGKSDLAVLEGIRNDILHDSPEEYGNRIRRIRASEGEDGYSRQVFMRSHAFKRLVPAVYDNTCCITGLRIVTALNVSMLDACHIVPFSQAYDDTVGNGLSLCPDLHRAFDRGLVTVDEDYRVIVSRKFQETAGCSHSIGQFAGRRLFLPRDEAYYPDPRNLAWHRRHVFRG